MTSQWMSALAWLLGSDVRNESSACLINKIEFCDVRSVLVVKDRKKALQPVEEIIIVQVTEEL